MYHQETRKRILTVTFPYPCVVCDANVVSLHWHHILRVNEDMHFVGIKCEVCGDLANCKDAIDDLPREWIALVQRARFGIFGTARQEALHFCSMECLCSWTREQAAKPRAVNE